jgi:diguanylate cyclase (GGDEF)-like protein
MEQRQPAAFEHFSDATNRWCDYRLSPSPDGGVIVFFVDITERKQAAERALLVAQHDALTGLPNRKLLREEAERILAAARRQGHRLAVLFLDLDRFKPINDTHGHEAGDKLLKAVAERIGRALRAEDLVGRVGGDEFVAVLVGIEDAADVGHVAANIVATVSRPYFINGLTLEIGTSVGISLFPMDGDTIDILFKRADLAMYAAKRAGRGRFAFFEHSLAPTGPAPTEPPLADRLRAALAAGEFTLDFQPVFAAGTSQVVEVEALLRWPQPDGSRIPPRDFLPLAETTGLIKPLGDWLLRTACAQQQRWLTEGIGEVTIGVTISGAQFRQPDFAARVAAIVRDSGMAPSRLLLNIAERTVTGSIDESIRILSELQAIGVGIAVKNFGAEQSDVRALSRLPAEKLRLDRSFLRPDTAAHAAADAIIGLGHSLQREVIAEGIEDQADMDYLKARGVQYWQGNLLAAPMAAEEFVRWWSARSAEPAPAIAPA